MAARRARGAGDRRAELRAGDHRVERRGGRDPRGADLRHDLVPGLPGASPWASCGDAPRWWGAVRRTDGQVLLSDGRPAETVYFSTSNGRTYGNEEVFGSSPLPYLRGVVERDDGASPTSRWTDADPVPRPRDVPRRGRPVVGWAADHRACEATATRVRVRGGGRTRTIDGSSFRAAVNAWAPCLRPDRYPEGALPTAIPSRWVTATSTGDAAPCSRGAGGGTARGWCSGARTARRSAVTRPSGSSPYYYGGLRPEAVAEPGLIHVQITRGSRSSGSSPPPTAPRSGRSPSTGPSS